MKDSVRILSVMDQVVMNEVDNINGEAYEGKNTFEDANSMASFHQLMQGREARPLIPAPNAGSPAQHSNQTRHHPPQHRMPSRRGMVERVCQRLEWCVLPPAPTAPPCHGNNVRCLRDMGLWCLARMQLVPSPVGQQVAGPFHCLQGARTHCASLCSLGPQTGGDTR